MDRCFFTGMCLLVRSLPSRDICVVPQLLEASEVIVICGDPEATLVIEHDTFHMGRKHPHLLKLDLNPTFRFILWCSSFTLLDSLIMLLRKDLLGLVVEQVCWS